MRQERELARSAGVRALGALLLLCCVSLSGSPVSAAARGTSLVITPPTRSVSPGESFQVDIVINTDAPTRGVQFGMTYDPRLIQIDQVVPGPFYQAWSDAHDGQGAAVLPFQAQNGTGKLSVGAIVLLGGPVDGPTGSGTVLSLHMTARSGATGRSPLLLTDVIVSSPQAESIPDVTWTGSVVGVGLAPEAVGPPPEPVMASADTPMIKAKPSAASQNGVLGALAGVPVVNVFLAGLLAGCAGTVTGLYLLGHIRIRSSGGASKAEKYALER